MHKFVIFSSVYQVCFLLSFVDTYVLFAANLDDFKSIAKKIVPDSLAEQLANLALQTSMKSHHDDRTPDPEDEDEYDEVKKTRFDVQNQGVNIDDTVGKVKVRLEKELETKHNNNRHKQQNNVFTSNKKINPEGRINKQSKYEDYDIEESKQYEDQQQKHKFNVNQQPKRIDDYENQQPKHNEDYENQQLKYEAHQIEQDDQPQKHKYNVNQQPKEYDEDYEEKQQKQKQNHENQQPKHDEKYDDYENAKSNQDEQPKYKFYGKKQPKHDSNENEQPNIKKKKKFFPNYDEKSDNIKVDDADQDKSENADILSQVSLVKHDSYEDYVIPEKDEPYDSASDENESKLQVKAADNKNQFNYYGHENSNVQITKQNSKEIRNGYDEDVQARTENLFYEDIATETTNRPVKNTMIPTKRYFTFSSPNYYEKLSTNADKYDFNEPLPEKDRQKEELKYLPNPPAYINNKAALKIK